jgi:hypothetical protein
MWPPSGSPERGPAHQLAVVVRLSGGLPTNPSMDPLVVVPTSPLAELPTEVAEGAEVNSPHELLSQDPVEPLELAAALGMVRSPIDHLDAPWLAVLPELLRDEAAPVVHVDRLRCPSLLEGPPEVVRGLDRPFSPIGSRHHEESGAVVEDGVHVDVSPDAGDSELVDIHLPERIDVTPLEPLERLGLLDDANHEPMALQ